MDNSKEKENNKPSGRTKRSRRSARNNQNANSGNANLTLNNSENSTAEQNASRNSGAKNKANIAVNNNQNEKSGRRDGNKLRIIPLGGLNEIGKNMTAIEYGNDIIVIDCGLGFPDEDMLGIDLVIPDITYLENNREKIRGILLTHGHEDHIGALPYVLRSINPPVYGTKLTLGIVKNKLEEFTLPWDPNLNTVSAGDTVKLGCFSVEFIRVNHSIADACALAITTPRGVIVHSGDFKIDTTPYEGDMINITRLGELGNKGVLLLMCESTNAERPGYTPSERKVGKSLEYIFTVNKDKRIVVATFSSNVHRVQQIIDISARYGRKVAITGRSMLNIVSAAVELGYMKIPAGVLIDINDIRRYTPDQLTLITTGSQGEPMSALYRMAYSDHNQVTLGQNDLVVLSASAIPGNEKLVGRVINELCKNGVKVLYDSSMEVHVSGHACQEELKLFQALVKPKYFMPVHGEYRHLYANREIALSLGMDSADIFISEIGKVLEIDRKGAKFAETVQAGKILVDGDSVGDIGNIVMRDRRHLAEDGLVVVVASVDLNDKSLLSGPDIVSRGFVYVRESDEMMEQAREVAVNTLLAGISGKGKLDRVALKGKVRDEVSKFLYAKTKRKPMVLPIIMYV
jgi:ribonuclease J